MSDLPCVSGKTMVRLLESLGWRVIRIQGSHHILHKAGAGVPFPVPVHGNQDVKIGTLRRILKQAGLTDEEFISALEK